jgi:tail fiber adhesin Gp38
VPQLGQGYQLGWTENQDSSGNQVLAPIQVTRLLPAPEKFSVEAEEALFTLYEGATPGGLNNRVIIIPSNINNVNLRDMHDSIYPEITEDDVSASPPVTLTVIINAGVIVGSTNTANPAFNVGDWPVGFGITMQINGRIQGKGGNGGDMSGGVSLPFVTVNGFPGGTALYTRFVISVEYGANAEVWGGGGGGASTLNDDANAVELGGGGGAGQLPGSGASGSSNGSPGTTEAGGSGAVSDAQAGSGGGPGMAGGSANLFGFPFGSGGAAGKSIDGVSFVTVTSGSGDIRGGTIN